MQDTLEEMNALRPLPICRCDPKCSCELVDGIRKDRDIDQVIRFLHGLTDDYNNLKSNVLVSDPLAEIYKVFTMAEKLERQIALANLDLGKLEVGQANAVAVQNEHELVAAVNSYFGRNSANQNKGAKCTHCGMSGHTVGKCFKKHGYPLGWIPGYKTKGKHIAGPGPANMESALSGATAGQMEKLISLLQAQMGQSSSSKTTAAVSLVPRFEEENTAEEGKYLSNLVNSVSLNSSSWILDSGATDHIVCGLKNFSEHYTAYGMEVNLPTGNSIIVKHTGKAKFNKDLWLEGVLHIPSFKFNLISMSKLLEGACYQLVFTSKFCLIQDAHGKTVGIAKQTNGL